MRRRHIHIHDKTLVWETMQDICGEKVSDEGAESGEEGGEERVVCHVALADAEEGAGADEAAEFEGGGGGGDGFAEG